jgi:hypothetical protein
LSNGNESDSFATDLHCGNRIDHRVQQSRVADNGLRVLNGDILSRQSNEISRPVLAGNSDVSLQEHVGSSLEVRELLAGKRREGGIGREEESRAVGAEDGGVDLCKAFKHVQGNVAFAGNMDRSWGGYFVEFRRRRTGRDRSGRGRGSGKSGKDSVNQILSGLWPLSDFSTCRGKVDRSASALVLEVDKLGSSNGCLLFLSRARRSR